jgi:hypothetical protein
VDVRVAEFVASTGADEPAEDGTGPGAFSLRGQFFVGSFDGSGRDHVGEFRISVPLPPDAGPAAISAARAEATVALARTIAAEGLR